MTILERIMKQIITLLIIFCGFNSVFSQTDEELLQSLPEFVKGSNYGTEFWLTIPPGLTENSSTDDFVKLFISSPWDSKITVTVAGKGYTRNINLAANTPDVISILPEIAQPYLKTAFDPVVESNIFRNSAIKVISDNPITLFVVVRYKQSSEGCLALPTSALGTEYQIASYGDASQYYPTYNSFPSLAGIVAPFDGTEVTFEMGGTASSSTSDGLTAGQTVKKTLNSGDVWLFSSMGRNSDLSGSKVSSNFPVSVLTANQCSNVPMENKHCGYILEQMLPTKFWATNYMISKFPGRKYSPLLRVFASQNNTNININGIPAATINTAGGILGEGFIEIRPDSDFKTGKGDNLKSDKPTMVIMYNTGVVEDGLPLPSGAPFMSILGADVHSQSNVRFILPGLPNDSKFNSNYLTLVTETNVESTIPDDIYVGHYDGTQFQKSRIKDMNPVITGDFNSDGEKDKMQITVKLPDYGTFDVSSDEHKFMAYLIGNNEKESYGYPAGLKLASGLNPEDTLAPEVTWSIDCMGVITGKSTDLPKDASVRSNLAGLIYHSNESDNIINAEFDKIIPGITSEMNWKLRVQNINEDATAVLTFWDQAVNTRSVVIRYTAPKIAAKPALEFFGSMKQYETSRRTIKIKNNSDSAFAIKDIKLKSGTMGFEITTKPDMPTDIQSKQELEVEVLFTASANGVFVDSIGYVGNCGAVYLAHLEAVVGNPVIEVPDVTFGDVTMGKTKTITATINNTGVSDLQVFGFTQPVNDVFEVEIAHDFAQGALIIAPNQQYSFTIHFTPIADATYGDEIIFSSDATTKDSICRIINTRGVKPGLVAESFDWNKRRIHRFDFPAGPYAVENESGGLSIRNTGDAPITISKVEQIDELNGEAFEFNRLQFNNLTINAGSEHVFDVRFRPETLGNHKLTLIFTDTFGNQTKSELAGFGVAPKIRNTILDFDTVPVRSYATPKKIKLKVENLGYSEWEFADTLMIYDFQFDSDEISTMKNEYGSNGFNIDMDLVPIPTKLAPGEFILIDVHFVPENEGSYSSEIILVGDAIDNGLITLLGYGLSKEISVQGGSGKACSNSSDVIISTVRNNGTQDVQIAPLSFKEAVAEFTFANASDVDGFNLSPGEMRSVEVLYTPTTSSNSVAEIIYADLNDLTNAKSAKLFGEVILYTANIKISPIEQSVDIGSEFTVKANFNSNIDFEKADLNEFIVSINYDAQILKPTENFIVPSDLLKGRFEIQAVPGVSTAGQYQFKVRSLGAYSLTGAGELFQMSFDAYYPNSIMTYSLIEIEVLPINNHCAELESTPAKINIKPVCVDDLRQFEMSDLRYKFSSVSPNPFTNNSMVLNFTVAINAHTTIKLTNSLGKVIETPLDSYLSKGEYELNINLKDISSGVYFIEIQSGPYSETQQIMIAK
ncbi:MAG: hypothetical protein CVV22_03240 [Ignavibacteriae bacterium HGW-Ignavibacteriae-1]|jgi:hypothetical protein|nr:MAG: hypothetical protein CVV22_03240 [Ignavibacteriae bacterium HGW-Ignavibacteriae-1]